MKVVRHRQPFALCAICGYYPGAGWRCPVAGTRTGEISELLGGEYAGNCPRGKARGGGSEGIRHRDCHCGDMIHYDIGDEAALSPQRGIAAICRMLLL